MWRLVTAGDSQGNPYLRTLNNFVGRQHWEYFPDAGTSEERARIQFARENFLEFKKKGEGNHSGDELLRLQSYDKLQSAKISVPGGDFPKTGAVDSERLTEHIRSGVKFYECIQQADGHWAGDYGGPLFLFPGLVVTAYVSGTLERLFPEPAKIEAVRYLKIHQNEDGGFGLHIEGPSTMFGTCLNYVVLRLLGMSADDPVTIKARKWMHERGGAVYSTSWGKFWLSVLGVYSWEGINPLPPEMWLLPHAKWTGIGVLHPGRMWCHCRMVYLPMCYVYGMRDKLEKMEPSQVVKELRTELYTEAYGKIDWNSCRNKCAKEDLYYPHPFIQDVLWWALYNMEGMLQGSWLRKKALNEVIKHIHYEDENTRYICIGPVNKAVNMLCRWLEDPESDAFKQHLARVPDYLWVAEDGLKMQGYNGSQLWDTAFSVQAIISTGLNDEFTNCLKKAHHFIEKSQVIKEVPAPLEKWYRHVSKGAWPFSSRDHGWPISDCSSEGLKAALCLSDIAADSVGEPVPDDRIFDCVNVLLSYQNEDGGMATYERTRSYPWIEIFNPAETFGDIIIDYSYVECTSACIQGMYQFSKKYPNHRAGEIKTAMKKARDFIISIQRKDGSWYGSWGVCFTYGTWFGVEALKCFGETYANSDNVRMACAFILECQKKGGGWGESYLSCQDKVYSQLHDSHAVNTAWAIMTLISAEYHTINADPIHRAVKCLLAMQSKKGDWPQQHISGVFNRNCMISYTNYRYLFPIWALGMYRREVLGVE